MADGLASLRALCGLRSAPALSAAEAEALRAELQPLLQRCDWFTIGVMAPSAEVAVAALRGAVLGGDPQKVREALARLKPAYSRMFLKYG